MRASALIVALVATASLGLADAEKPQDEHARIADWRADQLDAMARVVGWFDTHMK